jgi:uncharacterized OsmC-like protein
MPTIIATAKLIDNVRSVAYTRGHRVVMDLPVDQGGSDAGPSAYELAIMSIAGCALTIYADVARESNIHLRALEVEAEASKEPDSPKVTGVKLTVKVSGDVRSQKLRAIWRRTEALCPVVLMVKERIPLRVEFTVDSWVKAITVVRSSISSSLQITSASASALSGSNACTAHVANFA